QTISSSFLICWNSISTRKRKVFVMPELLQHFTKIVTYIYCFFLCRRPLCSVIFILCTADPAICSRPQQNAGLFLVITCPREFQIAKRVSQCQFSGDVYQGGF